MDKSKAIILLALFLVIPLSSALDFSVEVRPEAEPTLLDPQWENETHLVHNFNVSVENQASIGCQFRLRAQYSKNGETETVYSEPEPMFPGDESLISVKYFPNNYTGTVNSTVDVVFCGNSQRVKQYEFNVTERKTIDSQVKFEKLSVTEEEANISLEVKNGELIPLSLPPYWRAGPVSVKEGMASLEYSAPIFLHEEQLSYVMVRNGSVVGEVNVPLKKPKSEIFDKFRKRSGEIIALLFLVSVSANLYAFRRKILPEEVMEKLSEIEFEDRDIRSQ